jgi:hypothetical protein
LLVYKARVECFRSRGIFLIDRNPRETNLFQLD